MWAAIGAAVVRRRPFTLPPRLLQQLVIWQAAAFDGALARPAGDGYAALVSASPPPLVATKSDGRASPDAATRARRRRRLLVAALALGLVFALDLARSPARQLSARGLIAAIHLYHATLSPRLGAAGVRCRFEPSCSRFAEGAIRKDGALVGSARAAWRILRCGPWSPAGTFDPP